MDVLVAGCSQRYRNGTLWQAQARSPWQVSPAAEGPISALENWYAPALGMRLKVHAGSR